MGLRAASAWGAGLRGGCGVVEGLEVMPSQHASALFAKHRPLNPVSIHRSSWSFGEMRSRLRAVQKPLCVRVLFQRRKPKADEVSENGVAWKLRGRGAEARESL